MHQSHFARYIAACITHNRPIDRAFLMAETGADGEELESLINCGVCDFCMVSQGSTANDEKRVLGTHERGAVRKARGKKKAMPIVPKSFIAGSDYTTNIVYDCEADTYSTQAWMLGDAGECVDIELPPDGLNTAAETKIPWTSAEYKSYPEDIHKGFDAISTCRKCQGKFRGHALREVCRECATPADEGSN